MIIGFVMEGLGKRKWMSLTLLSIIVPMSLLATFRLTGILQGPVTISKTTTLETVKWEFQRPSQTVTLGDTLESSYTNDEISAAMHVILGSYIENTATIDYDAVSIAVVINSTTTNPNGFIENIYFVFSEDYRASKVELQETDFDIKNLSLVRKAEGINGKDSIKAFIKLTGVNHPNNVYLLATAFWKLLTPNIQTHQMEVVYELTYYNGTAYKKIIQPFQQKIIGK